MSARQAPFIVSLRHNRRYLHGLSDAQGFGSVSGWQHPPASSAHPEPIPGGQLLMSIWDLVLWQGEDTAGCQPYSAAAQELQGQPELLAGAAAPQPGAAQRRAKPDCLQASSTEGEGLGLWGWTLPESGPGLGLGPPATCFFPATAQQGQLLVFMRSGPKSKRFHRSDQEAVVAGPYPSTVFSTVLSPGGILFILVRAEGEKAGVESTEVHPQALHLLGKSIPAAFRDGPATSLV